jgi:hypothetical protein
MKFKSMQPTARQRAVRDSFTDLIRKEMRDVPADEILAVASYMAGQLVALQDQRKMTPEQNARAIPSL